MVVCIDGSLGLGWFKKGKAFPNPLMAPFF
jgi:hypothetical protein